MTSSAPVPAQSPSSSPPSSPSPTPPSPVSRPLASLSVFSTLCALTLLVVMLAGAVQVVGALRSDLEFPRTVSDFREGRSTQTLEKQIDLKLPLRSTLIATANSLRYTLLGGAGDQVRLGRDDWLYLADEVRFYPDADANQATRMALLGRVSQALAQRNVQLIVALVPDKARVHPQFLPWPLVGDGRLSMVTRNRYGNALTALRAQGVTTVDLLTPLRAAAPVAPVYYRTDTHWNQDGARIAAQAVADAARHAALALEPAAYETDSPGPVAERPGDLIRLMGLSHAPNALRPRPDREAALTTRQTDGGKAAGGLLGDADAVPVTLVGTSYALRGNFHGFLQQALSARVLNAARDGGGFLQAATDYFKDEAFISSPPRLLVWELPERFLGAALDQEAGWLKQVGLER